MYFYSMRMIRLHRKTLAANFGAAHRPSQLLMGANWDAEADGQPDPNALGDDNDGNDDEDGVDWSSTVLRPNRATTVDVTVNGPCLLDAWIDYDANGQWPEPMLWEHVGPGLRR